MRIAIPLTNGVLSAHFGHCEKFFIADVDREQKKIAAFRLLDAPEHEPGLLPRWLAGQGVTTIIAGGMGRRALDLFSRESITVVVGAPEKLPEQLVNDYLSGALQPGENACGH